MTDDDRRSTPIVVGQVSKDPNWWFKDVLVALILGTLISGVGHWSIDHQGPPGSPRGRPRRNREHPSRTTRKPPIDLTGADLSRADLTDATLTDANLQDVVYDPATIWPSGFVPPPSRSRR